MALTENSTLTMTGVFGLPSSGVMVTVTTRLSGAAQARWHQAADTRFIGTGGQRSLALHLDTARFGILGLGDGHVENAVALVPMADPADAVLGGRHDVDIHTLVDRSPPHGPIGRYEGSLRTVGTSGCTAVLWSC